MHMIMKHWDILALPKQTENFKNIFISQTCIPMYKIISDRDSRFAAKSMQALYAKLNITPALLTTYHPQTNGTTERYNQEIEFYLAVYISKNPNTWKCALPMIEFIHNTKPYSGRTN